MNPVLEALFGNRTAACVLLFLQCYGEGHAQRIAKTFDFGLNMTQRQLKRLEDHGVLVSRRLGNMRLFSFNERDVTPFVGPGLMRVGGCGHAAAPC
jgi:predicted transcriptional regulator